MPGDTREQFLDAAETLFAERGFYGVSIAAVGTELGLTKQALLHHFGSKEKLYGEVLKRISDRLEAMSPPMDDPVDAPIDQLRDYLLGLYAWSSTHADQARLLMRELLDNKQRAGAASVWYLKPFLQRLTDMVQKMPNGRGSSDAEALAVAYQLLGVINYHAVSGPTLLGILGPDAHREFEDAFESNLSRLIAAALTSN